jgi:hypothetical protein
VKRFDPSKICFSLSILCFVLFGILFGTSSIQAENSTPLIPAEPLTSIYRDSITQPLNKAAAEAKDADLSKFTKDLITSYELDKQSSTYDENDPNTLSNLLPDLFNINKKALTAPLVQAGKLIKDKEIAEFYSKFLSSIGIQK